MRRSAFHATARPAEEDKVDAPLVIPKQCPGCGAGIQHDKPTEPGFLPTSLFSADRGKDIPVREETASFTANVANLPEKLREAFTPMQPEKGEGSSSPAPPPTATRLLCSRCHSLIHHNALPANSVSLVPAPLTSLASLGRKRNAIVVVVADILSFPASLPQALSSVLGTSNPVLLALTKCDLLPKGASEQRIRKYVKDAVAKMGEDMPPIAAIYMVSAQKNMGVRELAAGICKIRGPTDNVHLVGRLNVGKSELVNALLRISVGGSAHKVTASWIPGTTAAPVAIPMYRFGKILASARAGKDDAAAISASGLPHRGQANLYDTPGLANPRITDLLSPADLKALNLHQKIKPATYRLSPGSSLLLGALGRLDHAGGDHTILITVFSSILPHITTMEKADRLLARHASGAKTILTYPDPVRAPSLPPLEVVEEFEWEGKVPRMSSLDISWPGIGWLSLTGSFNPASFRTWAIKGYGAEAGVICRPPLMPYEYTGRMERFTHSGRKQRP